MTNGRPLLVGLGLLVLAAGCEEGAMTSGRGEPSLPVDHGGPGDVPGGPGGGPGVDPGRPGFDPLDPDGPGPDAPDPGAPDPAFVAAETAARRLSRAELDATLRDLLGDDTRPATRLLPEEEYAPFDNDYTKQAASSAFIDAVESMANDVADRLVADPARVARVLPCAPSGAADADCLRQFVTTFGRRALRRPLAADEVEAYVALLPFAQEVMPGREGGFATVVGLVVRAMLQDPELLYRVEPAGPDLDDHAIATRMSYLLWGAPPDDALAADADAGRLRTAEGRRAAATRMLQDPRAREQVRRFHAMWLGYRTMPHPPALVSRLNRETERLIDRVVFDENRDYLDLFRLRETWVDASLAAHYGLAAPEGGEGFAPYAEGDGRAGILSHGSVLAGHSKGYSDSSPTQRGKFIQERLACRPIPPPPPNVMADGPPGDGEAECKKDRYAEHSVNPGCAGCHAQMDPIGFGLEGYDLAGRLRTHDDGMPECAIEGVGTLPDGSEFSGPAALSAWLADSGALDECAVRHWYAFAVGRFEPADAAERAFVRRLVERFRAGDRRLTDLIAEFVASDAFARRSEPADASALEVPR